MQGTLLQLEQRIAELDVIFKRLYKDNISGKLSDKRFIQLSNEYEKEQEELKVTFDKVKKELDGQKNMKMDVRKFVNMARKYTKLERLE